MARSSTSDSKPKPLHLKDLEKRFGVSRATIYRWRKTGYIPKGDIGPKKSIYSEKRVEQIEQKWAAADDNTPPGMVKLHGTFKLFHHENRDGMSRVMQ